MELTSRQKEVVNLMEQGWFGENSIVNNESSYLTKDAMKGQKVSIRLFNSLEDKKIIFKVRYNFALDRYYLKKPNDKK